MQLEKREPGRKCMSRDEFLFVIYLTKSADPFNHLNPEASAAGARPNRGSSTYFPPLHVKDSGLNSYEVIVVWV